MFSGLIPGLNSVNSPDNDVPIQYPAISISLLNLPHQIFLSIKAFSGTKATLFTQSLGLFQLDWSDWRSFVLLAYFCVFIPIVLIALSLEEGERDGGGGDTVAEEDGESIEKDKSPNALSNAYDASRSFCGICFEEKQNRQMFKSENCSHSFCCDCTSKHVEAKVLNNITVICCPGIDCKAELGVEACRSIVSKDIIDRWDGWLCMSLIPESQRVYCPFKDCSAMLVNDTGIAIKETECPACRRLICAKCRVPWHTEFTCQEFERFGVEGEGREDVLVEELAKKKSWRKCPNCKMCVEKSEGCLHITCRCGFEFCYMCGSQWDKSHVGCSRGQEYETSELLPRRGQEYEISELLPPPPLPRRGQEYEISELLPPPPRRGQEYEISELLPPPPLPRRGQEYEISELLPPPPPPRLPEPLPTFLSSYLSLSRP